MPISNELRVRSEGLKNTSAMVLCSSLRLIGDAFHEMASSINPSSSSRLQSGVVRK